MKPSLTIALSDPTPEFISLIQVKDHLKIDFDYENELIKGYIASAIEAAEDYTGLYINNRDVALYFPVFRPEMNIDILPVIDDGFKVEYLSAPDTYIDISDRYTFFEFEDENPRLIYDPALEWPVPLESLRALKVTFKAGYTKKGIPKKMIHAILLTVSDMYEFRTDRPEIMSRASMGLLRPYKLWD